MKRIPIISIVLLSTFLVNSCMSMEYDSGIMFTPLDNSFPVSASSSLFIEGDTITKEDYTVIKEFHFTKVSKMPLRKNDSNFNIDIQPELNKIQRKTDADGFVEISYQLIDSGSTAKVLAAMSRGTGSGLLILATYYGPITSISQGENIQDALMPIVPYLVISAPFFGLSFLLERFGKIEYYYRITGKAIKLSDM